MSLRVAVLDPSAFTLPYDDHLCRGLARADCQVTLLTRPFGRETDVRAAATNVAEIRCGTYTTIQWFYRLSERLPVHSAISPLKKGLKAAEHVWNMTSLCGLLRGFRPDVIHFQWSVVPAVDRVLVKRLRRIAPCVLTVHDTNAFLAPSSRLQKVGWHSLLRAFDYLIVHTKASKQAMIDHGIDESRVATIPHGVFDIPADNRHHTVNATSGRCVLLAFGSIKPYKGIDVLIRALAQLAPEDRRRVLLVIAGHPGNYECDLRTLAHRLGVDGSIEWILRFVREEEVPSLFARCDAVVFPYREIDASGALMTAMPYGKPIVATQLGMFAELLKDRETAYLVRPEDPAALAEAIREVVDDPEGARRMGWRAAELAGSVLSWDGIARLTMAAYGAAAESRRPGVTRAPLQDLAMSSSARSN